MNNTFGCLFFMKMNINSRCQQQHGMITTPSRHQVVETGLTNLQLVIEEQFFYGLYQTFNRINLWMTAWWWRMNALKTFFISTHCGPVTPFSVIDLAQHWFGNGLMPLSESVLTADYKHPPQCIFAKTKTQCMLKEKLFRNILKALYAFTNVLMA